MEFLLKKRYTIFSEIMWIPLLDFVNRKYKSGKEFYGMVLPKGLPLDVVKSISEKL